jgi:ring-1,2-phenylacetyl-CoA epoxidase subunit PaaC
MTASITLERSPAVQYVLRIADACLILSHRLSEWSGHAPVLEEDIALSNMALDLLGQARALLTHAATLEGGGRDEDQLAFLRDDRDFLNPTLAELPRGDFAFTVLRNLAMATWLQLLWQRLLASTDAELAGIAGKAVKEARYHREHAADWVVRLGDGSDESTRRMRDAMVTLWPYTNELFDADLVDERAASSGLGPRWSDLREPWLQAFGAVLTEAGMAMPDASAFRSDGKRGRHSEHLSRVLGEMQHLQRSFPGGVW